MQSKEIICTACPIGCRLTVYRDESAEKGFQIEGNTCKRGLDYAITEMTDPRRILTSTIKISNSSYKRLPVRTESAIPMGKIFDCMNEINRITVKCPVKMGAVLIKNIAETGISLISSRDMNNQIPINQ